MSTPSFSSDPANRAMEYGRLKPSDSARFTEPGLQQPKIRTRTNKLVRFALILLVLVFLVLPILGTVGVVMRHKYKSSSPSPSHSDSDSGGSSQGPETPLTRMCRVARFPDMCLNSLGGQYIIEGEEDGEGMVYGEEQDKRVVMISINVTMQRVMEGLDHFSSEKMEIDEVNDYLQWSAHEDCVELMEDSVDLLARAHSLLLNSLSTAGLDHGKNNDDQNGAMLDMMTWMTTTLTNHDTCMEGFEEAGGAVKDRTVQMLEELSQLVTNNLALSSVVAMPNAVQKDDVSIRQGRRLMDSKPTVKGHRDLGYPKWVSRSKRVLLDMSSENMNADITVSKDGKGPNVTVTSIAQAIKLAPKNSSHPTIIHIKAGRYEEADSYVGRNKTNLWFIGDGMGKTIITGNKSVAFDRTTTYRTASFGAHGYGFVARGITFENTAGPENHQAVAIRVKSDHAIFYQCEMKGYQDTLYVHSNRQFYRECDIYGTVDFIFGNAKVIFQNCTLYARKPMDQQKNTITAQKRNDLKSYSGISIHGCQVRASPDLEPLKANYSTYLGRPWKELATVVYMLSYIGDHVDPQGWMPWNTSWPQLDSVYYGEFMNYGPGANTTLRVKSPGIHVNLSVVEARQFTVDLFEGGSKWIKPTRVPFEAGLGKKV